MNANAEYKMKRAYQKLFQVFRSELAFRMPVQSNQNVTHGGFETAGRSYSQWQDVEEPLWANNSSTVNQLISVQGGTATDYQFIWLSHHNVPVKTEVQKGNQLMSVTSRADYKEFAGIYEYYLKGRSDNA